MKIKEILKKVECECGNKDYKKFEVYFVMNVETGEIKKYISCLRCNEVYELKIINLKDIVLEPTVNVGG